MRGKANIFWLILAALLGMPLGLRSQPGSLDLSFNPNLNDGAAVYALALQPDGKILIGGSFYFIDDQLVINVARLNPDGSLDSTFVPGSAADSGYVSAIAVQNDGKVLIGGSFYSSRGVTPNNLARLNSDGTVATDFHTNSNLTVDGPVNAIVVQSDGKILLGGSFGVVDLPRKDIARLNPDGTLDTNFDACVSAGAGSGATALAVLNSGKILASGDFGFSLGGLRRGGIARLNPNGNLDTSYAGVQPGILPTGSTPYTLAVHRNGTALLGGDFRMYRTVSCPGIAQFTIGGEVDTTFTPGTGIDEGTTVYAMALQPDEKILLGGNFSSYNGTTKYGVARINANGALDAAFDPGSGPSYSISSFAIQKDERILVAGKFAVFNGQPRKGLARLNGDHLPFHLGPPVPSGNGQFQLMFYADTPANYALEVSSNLLTWASVTNFTSTSPATALVDSTPNSGSKRFYRAVSAP